MSDNEEDLHIIEAVGRSKIIIRNGNVAEVSVSRLRNCPLAKKFARPVNDITPDEVKANIKHRMDSWGMCTPHRKISGTVDFVGFGASELIQSGILSGSLDAAVLACDGAGTVIVTKPEMVQGIGGRMSGLVSTSPHHDEMDRIEQAGGIILDRAKATINPILGVAKAYKKGFTRVAVTVASADAMLHPDAVSGCIYFRGAYERYHRRGCQQNCRGRRYRNCLRLEMDLADRRSKGASSGWHRGAGLCDHKTRKTADPR